MDHPLESNANELNSRPSLVYIAKQTPHPEIWTDIFKQSIEDLGRLTLIENGESLDETEYIDLIREHDILLTGWDSRKVPECIADDPGKLKYICYINGSVRHCIPLSIIENGIPVTNWGEAPARRVAEGAMALLHATLKDLHHHIRNIEQGEWGLDTNFHGGSLYDLEIGIFGLGAIGRAFLDLIRPYNCTIKIYDPYLNVTPEGCRLVDSKEDLFNHSKAIIIHAALTEETRGAITGDLLKLLPRHGVVINTARGAIVDQKALFAELKSGRLRAGLDVLDHPDKLPADHPARHWDNLILSSHKIEFGWPTFGEQPDYLIDYQQIAIKNIKRFINDEPLQFTIDVERYLRST